MPEIRIRGFRGAERADIKLEPIALLAGPNFQGKSSLCQAAAAVVTGLAIPFYRSTKPDKPLLTKSAAKQLVRGGMDKGSAQLLDGDEVLAQVNWPALQVTGTGDVQCSQVSAGLVNPLEMEDADRQAFFSALLESQPTYEDLSVALKDAGVPKEEADGYVREIGTQGWDVLHRMMKDTGARLKGQWEAHAATKFGATKAESWRPEGWRAELEGITLEAIGAECTTAQHKVEEAIAALAVGEEQRAQLRERAAKEEQAEIAKEKAGARLQAAQEDYNTAKAALAKIVVPTAIPCPECGAALDVVSGAKVGTEIAIKIQPSKLSAKQISDIKEKHDVARSQYEDALAALEAADRAWQVVKAAWEVVKGSKAALLTADTKKGTQDAVDVARDFLSGKDRDKARVTAVLNCTAATHKIAANQKVIDILAPEGLRRQKLAKALAEFNKSVLAPLCAAADYATITLNEELDLLYGGRPHFLLSASEQYRVRAVLQLAIAEKDGSPVAIFDGADMLDQRGRNGLFNMLASKADHMGFIVAMTVEAPEDVPDLAAAGLGHTYWIKDGVALAAA